MSLLLSAFAAPRASAAVVFSNVADTSTAAPGHGAFTGFFLNPSISGSTVTFAGSYSGGTGIYTGSVGTTGAVKIVDTTNTAPGHGAFTSLTSGSTAPSISGSTVAFAGTYSGGNGLYTGTVGAVGAVKVVDTTDTAPGQGPFSDLTHSSPSISGSNLAFRGTYEVGTGIYTGTVGATGAVKIVDTTDTAPGHGHFTGFGNANAVSVSGSNLAIFGRYSGGSGIYTGSVGTGGVVKMVDTSDTPPQGGTFSDFDVPSISGNTLAFRSLSDSIYTANVGVAGVTKVADTTDSAPGHGNFMFFSNPSLSGNTLAFRSGDTTGGAGIYLASVGVPNIFFPVDHTSDPLFGSTVSTLSMDVNGYDNDTIAFKYSLANGKSGIAVASVPEPASLSLVALAGAMVMRRTRRPARKTGRDSTFASGG